MKKQGTHVCIIDKKGGGKQQKREEEGGEIAGYTVIHE